MKTKDIIYPIVAVFAGALTFAEEAKKEVNEANVHAEAKAVANSRSVSTTVVNGKPVTFIEEPDENGRMRRKMITYSPSGKPKVKDITPKEKLPVDGDKNAPDANKKPANKKQANKNGGDDL